MNNTWVNRLERQLSSVQWLRSRLTETLPPSTCDFSCHPEIISIPPEGREKKNTKQWIWEVFLGQDWKFHTHYFYFIPLNKT